MIKLQMVKLQKQNNLTTLNKQKNIIFSSKKHTFYTVNQKKIALSAVERKMYILNDGIKTLVHGHWRIAAGALE